MNADDAVPVVAMVLVSVLLEVPRLVVMVMVIWMVALEPPGVAMAASTTAAAGEVSAASVRAAVSASEASDIRRGKVFLLGLRDVNPQMSQMTRMPAWAATS